MTTTTDRAGTVVEPPSRRPGAPFPPPEYATYREHDGLVRTHLPGTGQPVWLVTRHEDVRAVLTNPAISANPASPGFPKIGATGGVPSQDEVPGWFVGLDPPDHDRFRKALIPEFSVRRIDKWRPTIQETVDGCLDDLLARGTTADLMNDFALAVPSIVISTMLGVPRADRDFFESRTRTLVDLRASTDTERAGATKQLLRYVSRLIAIKARRPGDDVISRTLAKDVLTPQELSGVVMLLLIAGHETTANNIALGVLTLLSNPEWIGDDAVVEELVRHHSVADLVVLRTAVTDVEIGGQLVRAGEGIIPLLAAANHDPAAFECPHAFDPSRSAKGHVGFGYGVHQCLGQNLVRAEMEIALRTLFARIPTLRVTTPVADLPFKYTGTLFGVHELPVAW